MNFFNTFGTTVKMDNPARPGQRTTGWSLSEPT